MADVGKGWKGALYVAGIALAVDVLGLGIAAMLRRYVPAALKRRLAMPSNGVQDGGPIISIQEDIAA